MLYEFYCTICFGVVQSLIFNHVKIVFAKQIHLIYSYKIKLLSKLIDLKVPLSYWRVYDALAEEDSDTAVNQQNNVCLRLCLAMSADLRTEM